jgi:hypothetical protein
MKIVIKNLDKEFKRLKAEVEDFSKNNLQTKSKELFSDLVNATPIDTGLAQASWEIAESKNKVVIQNTVEYIQNLNNGSSKQAPANFIERTALRYGKPVGAIVTTKIR